MITSTPTWLNYLAAIGAIATPILVAALGLVCWKIRNRIERQFALEQALREDRVATYNEILEPFMIMLMTDEAWKADPKKQKQGQSQPWHSESAITGLSQVCVQTGLDWFGRSRRRIQ